MVEVELDPDLGREMVQAMVLEMVGLHTSALSCALCSLALGALCASPRKKGTHFRDLEDASLDKTCLVFCRTPSPPQKQAIYCLLREVHKAPSKPLPLSRLNNNAQGVNSR